MTAGWTDKFMGDLPPAGTPGFHTQVMQIPVGVCGAIVPWNYPVVEMAKIVGPCLAAGCTLIYKTNEYTPLNVLRCMELLEEAGLVGTPKCNLPLRVIGRSLLHAVICKCMPELDWPSDCL